ncbi:hypothetical protein BKA81DRAFT_24191 [Phyllosticta paracitricarpa]
MELLGEGHPGRIWVDFRDGRWGPGPGPSCSQTTLPPPTSQPRTSYHGDRNPLDSWKDEWIRSHRFKAEAQGVSNWALKFDSNSVKPRERGQESCTRWNQQIDVSGIKHSCVASSAIPNDQLPWPHTANAKATHQSAIYPPQHHHISPTQLSTLQLWPRPMAWRAARSRTLFGASSILSMETAQNTGRHTG